MTSFDPLHVGNQKFRSCVTSVGLNFHWSDYINPHGQKLCDIVIVPSTTRQSEIDLRLRISFDVPLSCVVFRGITSLTLATKWRTVNWRSLECKTGTRVILRFSSKISENKHDFHNRSNLHRFRAFGSSGINLRAISLWFIILDRTSTDVGQ